MFASSFQIFTSHAIDYTQGKTADGTIKNISKPTLEGIQL